MDGMHVWSTASSSTFEAFPRTRAFVFTLPWLFCILASQVFNFFSSDRHFSSDKFSFGSSWPFFFHLCLLSFSVLSSKERLHIRLVLLGNPCKIYQHQSVGKRWNESPFSLPAEQLAHPNMYTLQVLTILKLLAEYRLALWRGTEKHDESSALATQCETPCATRLSYHGICTILRAIRTIYVIRKGPIRRKMNFTYVLGFVVLRDVVKVFPVSSSFVCEKDDPRNRVRSHSGAWRGLKTKWDLKWSLPSPTYLIRYLFI